MDIRLIDRALVAKLTQEAEASPRQRAIYRFHEHEEPIQRMVNVFREGSYVCPHRHLDPDKTEVFLVLQGRGILFTFDDEGQVIHRQVLDPAECWGVEIPPGTWHMVAALTPVAAFYEIIDGPYDARTHKHFAPWAPQEGDPAAPAYLAALLAQ